MYTEKIDNSEYKRLEKDDWDELEGKRIKGHGKIVGFTNAVGEHHPAVLNFKDAEPLSLHELPFVEFDGRHGFMGI